MRVFTARLGILWVLALALAGCSGGEEHATGPGGSVQDFFTALNDGDYDAAKGMYNAEAARVLDDPTFAAEGAFREWAEAITKQGSIRDVHILGTEETEGSTQVSYEVVYADGSNRAGDVSVTLEDGAYRLGLVQ